MFRRFPRPRTKPLPRPAWAPPLASPESRRGIKLYKLAKEPSDFLPIQARKVTSNPADVVNEHGRELLNKIAAKGIGVNTEQKAVRTLSGHSMTFKVAPRHTVAYNDLRYFTLTGHGYAEAVMRRYLSHHEERPLWVSTTARGGAKSIVNGKASYRIGAALKQALRSAGYDAYGRRMSEADWERHCKVLGADRTVALGPKRQQIAQLHGSVDIVARDANLIHQLAFVDLRKHFDKVVRTLEEIMGRTKHGVPVGKSGISSGRPRPQDKFPRGRPQDGDNYGRPYNNSGDSWQNRPPGRHSQSSSDNRGRKSFQHGPQ